MILQGSLVVTDGHNTVRLPHETQKFVVVDGCMAAIQLM